MHSSTLWYTASFALSLLCVDAGVIPSREVAVQSEKRNMACTFGFPLPNYANAVMGDEFCMTRWQDGIGIAAINFWGHQQEGSLYVWETPIARMEVVFTDKNKQVIGRSSLDTLVSVGSITLAPDEVFTSLEISPWGGGGISGEASGKMMGSIKITTNRQSMLINDPKGQNPLPYKHQDVVGGVLQGLTGWADHDNINGLNFFFAPPIKAITQGEMNIQWEELTGTNGMRTEPFSVNSDTACNPRDARTNYTMSLTPSHKVTTSVTTTDEGSFTFGVAITASAEVDVPLLAKFSLSETVSFSGQYTHSVANANIREDSTTWSVSNSVSPGQMVTCGISCGHAIGKIPYWRTMTMTFVDGSTPHTWVVKGAMESEIFSANAQTFCTSKVMTDEENATCGSNNKVAAAT